MAILKLEFTPRAKGAVKSAGKSAKYYTFREGDDRAGRIWRARDGRNLEYDEARELVRHNARTHGYTYRVMISTKDSPLKIEDYRQVMETLGEKWLDYCFVEHRNTDYPHAHILAWSKSQVNQAERKRMYERVKELEQQRDRERQQRVDQVQERRVEEQRAKQVQPPQVERQRDRGYDLDL